MKSSLFIIFISALLAGYSASHDSRLGKYSLEISSSDFPVLRNLDLAVKSLNGMIIRPGERFSLNHKLGKRTTEKGYKKARVFSGTGIALEETGGGICMISTLLYNIFARAGIKIVERHPHLRVVSYVEPGFDAAINWATKDLVIENNLKGSIRLVLSRNGRNLSAAIYSDHVISEKIELKRKISFSFIPGLKKNGFRVKLIRSFFKKDVLIKEEILSNDTFREIN